MADTCTDLDELHTDTLADSRVRLLGLDDDLLEHDAGGMGRAHGRTGLVDVAERTLLVRLVGPSVLLAHDAQLSGSVKTARFVGAHSECVRRRETEAGWRLTVRGSQGEESKGWGLLL